MAVFHLIERVKSCHEYLHLKPIRATTFAQRNRIKATLRKCYFVSMTIAYC